ncbi:MAG: hypothetical protein IT385_09125 [Deltaproteobacteria bacterium]|nr:hypothetical protein [Deltaproteobacteria bacterium]
MRTDVGARARIGAQTPARGGAAPPTMDFGSVAQDVLDPRAPTRHGDARDPGPLTEDYGRVLERAAREGVDAPRMPGAAPRSDILPASIDARHETSSTEDFGPAVALRAQLDGQASRSADEEVSPHEWNAGPRTEDLGPVAEPAGRDAASPAPNPARFVAPRPPAPEPPPSAPPPSPFPAASGAPKPDDDSPRWVGIAVLVVVVAIVVWMLTSR